MADHQGQHRDMRIPVTVLTGFLGAGKTTLMNWILSANHGKKLAVIENEFGETGVDEEILMAREHSDEIMVEVKNGCICCTVRGDLVNCLNNLFRKTGGKLDGIIIECTGLADPAPVCQTFFIEPSIQKLFKIDAVITVVDSKHLIQHLADKKPDGVVNEAIQQVAFADKILLNKTDLVTGQYLDRVIGEIRSINPYAKIIKCQLANQPVNMNELLGIEAFELARVNELDPSFLQMVDADVENQAPETQAHGHGHGHGHDDCDHDCSDPEHSHGHGHGDCDHDCSDPNHSHGAHGHVHDQSVSSIGFKLGPNEQINMFALKMLIGRLIEENNEDLFRYKGVIAIKGKDRKYIFQGVHMLYNGDFASPWGDAERNSCFCFIGKNLPNMNVEEGFRNCIAKDLRWGVGKQVRACCQTGFEPGEVIKVWDDGNAYRIRLHNGVEVWAPIDDDRFVRSND